MSGPSIAILAQKPASASTEYFFDPPPPFNVDLHLAITHLPHIHPALLVSSMHIQHVICLPYTPPVSLISPQTHFQFCYSHFSQTGSQCHWSLLPVLHICLLRNLCPVSSAEPALTSCSSGQRWPPKLHFWSFQFGTGWVVWHNVLYTKIHS